MAVGFLIAAAGAQPAAAGAQSLQQTAGQTVPTTLTAPDPYPRDATTFLTRGGQQVAVRPLRTTLTAGGARVVADRILVNFNQPVTISDLTDIQAKAARAGAGTAMALVRIGAGSFMIDVTGAASIEAAAQAYKNADPRVVGAGPDYMMHGDETPNDTDFGKQTDMAVIQAPSAWNRTHGSSSKVIAVLDTGLNDIGPNANPEFAGKVVGHRDFTASATSTDDFLGHGTHVAGIAAAATNNALGIAGAGYDTRLLVAKVLDDTGSGSMSQLTDAIYWAADQGISVINMSLASTEHQDCSTTWWEDLFDTGRNELRDAINYAFGKNIVLVAAAGNNGDTQQLWPGACPNVVSVANTDNSDHLNPTSTHGTWVDVAAPGTSVWSTAVPGGEACISGMIGAFAFCTGTSMATPHVSGLAALVQASCGLTNPTQVISRITGTADPIAGTGVDFQSGRINALKAVCFPAPLSLRLGTLGPDSMQLLWIDTTPGESFFQVWSEVTGSGVWTSVNVPANSTSFTHTGLVPDVSYDHKVRACDASGCSPFSNTVTANAGYKRLTVSVTGSGTVTAPGITCGQTSTDCTELYAPNRVVTLHPAPHINPQKNIWWDFDHWEGACAGAAYDCTLTMNASKSARAVFVQAQPDPLGP